MASRAAKELAKARATRRSEIDRKYRERHPVRAREERDLRKANARLLDCGNYREATPETLQKARIDDGSLARLCRSGSIDADQLAWACEIRMVHDRIAGDVRIGTASLEGRVDQSRHGDGTVFEKLGAVRAEVAYTRWRASLPAPGLVLAMIVEDLGCNAAAARFSRHKRTVRKLLIDALDAWPHFQRDACDAVDEATLLAAQAAILGTYIHDSR